jgi:hypothetical protein
VVSNKEREEEQRKKREWKLKKERNRKEDRAKLGHTSPNIVISG